MNSTPSSNNMAVVRAAATHGSSLANSGVAGVLTLARAAAKFKGQGKVEVATASKSLSYDEVEILTGVLKMRQLVVSSPTVLTPLDECFMLSMDDVVCAEFLRPAWPCSHALPTAPLLCSWIWRPCARLSSARTAESRCTTAKIRRRLPGFCSASGSSRFPQPTLCLCKRCSPPTIAGVMCRRPMKIPTHWIPCEVRAFLVRLFMLC